MVDLLKKKGTGPTMSKSLWGDEFSLLERLFQSGDVNLTTKATMLTALLTLEANEEEKAWLDKVTGNPAMYFPAELLPLIRQQRDAHPFIALIRQVIAHHDLDQRDFENAMAYFFDDTVPEFMKAAFLEGERLKRETLLENSVCYDAFWQKSRHYDFNGPVLIDLSVSYDGFNRSPYLSLFAAPLLASAGFPVITHGLDSVSPKFGVNPYVLLKAAGKNPQKQPEETVADLANRTIGWGYIDQAHSFPELNRLRPLRKNMVKRPILATLEKLLQPIRSVNGNYLVTGYTHPPYKQMLQDVLMLKHHSPKFLILRGVEGSIQLALDRRSPYVLFDGNDVESDFVRPEDFHLTGPKLEPDKTMTAEDSLQMGLEALHNVPGYARDSVLYLSQLILTKFGFMTPPEAAAVLEKNLASGAALAHWERGVR